MDKGQSLGPLDAISLSATYGWVFGQLRVDPNDENTIYVMGLALNVSHDGGKTFSQLGGMHGGPSCLYRPRQHPREE